MNRRDALKSLAALPLAPLVGPAVKPVSDIGACYSHGTSPKHFTGEMHDVHLYSRQLTDDEIRGNFDNWEAFDPGTPIEVPADTFGGAAIGDRGKIRVIR